MKQFQIMSHKEETHPIPDMVRDMVRRAESRLAELQARKQHLRCRVQALRFLATQAAEGRATECRENPHSGPSSSERLIKRTAPVPNVESAKDTTRLRRACRIALMESDQPQSPGEIYQRICQRGSLSFIPSHDALHLLASELELMEKELEVTCCIFRGEKRWRRSFCE